MSLRDVSLKAHLYVGLAAAVFLAVAGGTGAILAFETDYDRWLHPSLWYVTPRDARRPEEALLKHVEAQFAPARVEEINVESPRIAHVFTLTNGHRVFVDPYEDLIRGERPGISRVEAMGWFVERLHVGLMAGPFGRWFVDVGTAAVMLLIPTGLVLWWRRRQWRVGWAASWRRVSWDLHNTIGLYGCVTLLILCVTGLLLASDDALLWITRTSPWRVPPLPRSVLPDPPRTRLDLDQLALAADRALPASPTYAIRLPMRERSPVQFLKHAGGGGRSTVFVDEYAGTILRVDDFSALPGGYRAHELVRAIHTGDVFGTPTRILMTLSSLGLVSLVVTGTFIWWRKVIG